MTQNFTAISAEQASGVSLRREPANMAHLAIESPQEVIIATVNRPEGQTGVHTHTRVLDEGLVGAGIPCSIESPFSHGPHWLPIFAIRRIFHALAKSWSTRWYRRWHRAALRDNLLKRLAGDVGKTFNGVVLAQCPVSADAAMEARRRLKLRFPVAMVCHFNFSEAQEYREKGELDDEDSYNAILDFEKRVLSTVEHVIYVSRWARDIVEITRGIRTRASSVVWNGVPQAAPLPVARAAIGLEDGDLVLINVGTLEARKNQLGLIDLFEAVVGHEPRARLVLVGEGPHRSAIEDKIRQKNLSGKVKLLGHRTDVAALLPAADLYVHYSSLENCPVVLLEAARAALPMAAIPAGGVPELLESLGGIALDANSIANSLNALQPLLADAALRKALGGVGRERFRETFTREAMVSGYVAALGLAPVDGRNIAEGRR